MTTVYAEERGIWQVLEREEGEEVVTPMMGSDVTRRFQALLSAAGLPRMRFHDLRHGTASLPLAQGVHPRVVMECSVTPPSL